ncbi:MAG TPA: hypothetical protein VFM53_15390 [Anaeromyxobacteraceae bacterium]|nr:hypothetical protein [Anaeromyxobacteraceae bacterium]
MTETTQSLESRLEELLQAVARLEGRVTALEQARAPSPARRAVAAVRSTAAGGSREEGWNPPELSGTMPLLGRTLLVLAGAFVLRALTDGGRLPGWMGVGLGLAYAGAWLWMADRAGSAGKTLSAGFHAVTVVIIGFPLLFEAATRFKLLSPLGAAALLALLTGAALLLSARRSIQVLAWVVSLGGLVTAVALMAASGRLVPGTLYLVLLGTAALWIGYVRDWTLLRWPLALAVDLMALLVAIHATDPGTREGPVAALAVLAALVACYLGSFAARTLWMGRRVVPFEVVQTAAVIAVGIGGAVWVALRSGLGQGAFGVTALAFGAACYGVAFAFVERRQRIRENFWFYASVGLVLVPAGVALLAGEPVRSLALCGLSLAAAEAARRGGSRTLSAHAVLYAVLAGLASGLVAGSFQALFLGAQVAWTPSFASVASLVAAAVVAALASRLPRAQPLERIPVAAANALLALGAAGTAVAWLAPLVAGTGTSTGAGALATLRTVVLVALVVAAAWAGRNPARVEVGWLAYPVLALTGLKMLLEDLPRGRPATLILAFACYGAALIAIPRIRAHRAPAPGPAGVP